MPALPCYLKRMYEGVEAGEEVFSIKYRSLARTAKSCPDWLAFLRTTSDPEGSSVNHYCRCFQGRGMEERSRLALFDEIIHFLARLSLS